MAIEHEGPAPYTSPSTIIHIVERFRERGLQTPFDADVLIRAGVSEGLAQRTMHSLRQLDLIDDQGNPSDALDSLRLAPGGEYKDRFAEVIRAAYAPIFQYVDPENDPLERIRDAFRPYSPVGQQGRMVTLFLGLAEYAGIVPPRPKLAPTQVGSTSGRPRRGPRPKQDSTPAVNGKVANQHRRDVLQPGGHALTPMSDVMFGVTDADIAKLTDDEFNEVWAALGKVARARSREAKAGSDVGTRDEGGEQ
jgi:hypothetical protein